MNRLFCCIMIIILKVFLVPALLSKFLQCHGNRLRRG